MVNYKWIAAHMVLALSGCQTSYFNERHEPIAYHQAVSLKNVAYARIQLGLAYLESNHYQLAYKSLQKAELAAPNTVDVYLAYARYYDVLQQPENVIASLKQAVHCAPENQKVYKVYRRYVCQQRYPKKECPI